MFRMPQTYFPRGANQLLPQSLCHLLPEMNGLCWDYSQVLPHATSNSTNPEDTGVVMKPWGPHPPWSCGRLSEGPAWQNQTVASFSSAWASVRPEPRPWIWPDPLTRNNHDFLMPAEDGGNTNSRTLMVSEWRKVSRGPVSTRIWPRSIDLKAEHWGSSLQPERRLVFGLITALLEWHGLCPRTHLVRTLCCGFLFFLN